MVVKMRAIEYNFIMTIIKLLCDKIPDIASDYGVTNVNIPVLPAYPTDLTRMEKPSIIVRKVDTRQSKIGIGNVLGQYYNEDNNSLSDVVGKRHDTMVQIDVVTSNNSDRLLFESMIMELITNISVYDNGRIDFMDFTSNIDSPTKMGTLSLIEEPFVDYLHDSESSNKEYISILRQKFATIQTIVISEKEVIDLSKGIKQPTNFIRI